MEQVANPAERLMNSETLKIFHSFTFPLYRTMHSALDFGAVNVRLITKARFDWLFMYDCKEGWEAFFRNYKGAKSIIWFSNVGYRANGREAIVYFAYGYGCMFNEGGLVLLEKKQDQWKVVKFIGLWIS